MLLTLLTLMPLKTTSSVLPCNQAGLAAFSVILFSKNEAINDS
jgi:hypothetical protein